MSRIMVARAHVPLTKRGFAVEGRCANTDRASWEPRSMEESDPDSSQRFECGECGDVFDSKRGLSGHETRIHEMDAPWRDETTLRRLYHGEKLNIDEVAEALDCSRETVMTWMDRRDVERRSRGEGAVLASDPKPWHDESTLRGLYYDKQMSIQEVADELGCSFLTAWRWMDQLGIERRTSAETREIHGTANGPVREGPHTDPDWLQEKYYDEGLTLEEMASEAGLKSDVSILRWMDKYGFERREAAEYLRKDDAIRTAKHHSHEQISFTVDGQTHYYDVHRLLAIAVFGLEAVAGKIVHHINGIPWDNRPGNFELIESQAEHARRHAEDRERDELGRFT